MNPQQQQQLQNYYQNVHQPMNYQQPPSEHPDIPRTTNPIFWVLFGVVIVVGLMLMAFYFGVLIPIVQKVLVKNSEETTKETVVKTTKVIKLDPKDPNDSFALKAQEHGLLDTSFMNGVEVSEDFLNSDHKDDSQNETPNDEE